MSFEGWERLDTAEKAAGVLAGKIREKVVEINDMLNVAQQDR